MKNKIIDILLSTLIVSTDKAHNPFVYGHIYAAQLIEQLMCDESVKLLMISDEYHDNPRYMVECWWYEDLLKSYSESTIKKAIEKCKEENKCK